MEMPYHLPADFDVYPWPTVDKPIQLMLELVNKDAMLSKDKAGMSFAQ